MSRQNNKQRLCIPDLGNIFGPFFFEFSKVNVLKINLTKIFLNYAPVKPHNNLGFSAQNLTKRNFFFYKE